MHWIDWTIVACALMAVALAWVLGAAATGLLGRDLSGLARVSAAAGPCDIDL